MFKIKIKKKNSSKADNGACKIFAVMHIVPT
jgi:hypothetical protein